MNRRTWRVPTIFCVLAFLLVAAHLPACEAADPAQKALIGKLVAKLRAPYTTRAFGVILADLEQNVAAQFINGFGKGAKLTGDWQRGNPYWERAHARLITAIREEEARAGPIFVIRESDVAASLDPPWSADEIEFLLKAVDTEFGTNYVRFLDMMLVPAFISGFRNMKDVTGGALAQLQELETEAKREIGSVTISLMTLEEKDAQTARRIRDLIGRLSREDGKKLGESIMKPTLARLIGAMYSCVGDFYQIAEEFRRAARDSSTRS